MSFAPEPAHRARDRARRPRSLLCNLGTPDEPTPAAVRRYLAEFLSDPRVVEIPRLLWLADPARHHPAHAAGAVGAQVREHLDAGRLAAQGLDREAGAAARRLPRPARPPVLVRHAMRYGQPSIAGVLDALQGRRRRRACWCCRSTRSTRRRRRRASATRVAAWMQRAPQPARAALRQALPRRPGLHRRAGAPRQRPLA